MVSADQAHVVILTALELEYQAVLDVHAGAAANNQWMEAHLHRLPVATREFLGSGGKPLRVAVARAPDMGKGSALTTLMPLVDSLKPSVVAMCGVCAGRPGKTNLGDVIAAERLFDHDSGKETPAGFQADLRTYSLPAPWKVALERFAPHRRFGSESWWLKRPVPLEWQARWALQKLASGVTDPRAHPDAARHCAQWPEVIENLWSAGYVENGSLRLTDSGKAYADKSQILYGDSPDLSPTGHLLPFTLHVAPFGSGSAVIEDDEIWGFISQHMRKTLAIDMEASALADLVRARPEIGAVVMKGVMDYANHGRDDHFKAFAARASAEALLAFLRDQLPPPSSSSTISATSTDDGRQYDESRLYRRLNRAGDTVFEKIVLLSNVDRSLLCSQQACLADRINGLISLVRNDPALRDRIESSLDTHAPWTKS